MKTIFTKTILLGTIISVGFFSISKAQSAYDDQYNQYNDQYAYSQPQYAPNNDQSFYYYPDANVYYDMNCNKYIYNNGRSWLTVNVLPANICLTNAPRYMVYHRGPQVWLDNPMHVRNYYRPAYRQPIVAFNFRSYGGRRDFDKRDFDRRDYGRDRHDRGRGRW